MYARKLVKKRRRRPFRLERPSSGMATGAILLIGILAGPAIIAWFSAKPWATPLAVFTTICGLVGILVFSFTLGQMRRQEAERRRLLEADWRNFSPSEFEHYVAGMLILG